MVKELHVFIDMDVKINIDSLRRATQVLLFMLVCINGNFKIPILLNH